MSENVKQERTLTLLAQFKDDQEEHKLWIMHSIISKIALKQ